MMILRSISLSLVVGIGTLQGASAWSWSLSDKASNGPRVHGHTCVTTKIKTATTTTTTTSTSSIDADADDDDQNLPPTNDRIYLFGGQLPHGVQPTGVPLMTTASPSKSSTTKKALPSSPPLTPPATHDLWVYEKDKINDGKSDADDWELMPRKIQGVSRPTKRMYAASAVLGHTLYLFGGIDPDTGKSLSDIWTHSLKTNKWTLVQAWLPYAISNHSACTISDTSIAIHTGTVANEILVFVSDGRDWSVVRQTTTGDGPRQLQNCACTSIARSTTTTITDNDNYNDNNNNNDNLAKDENGQAFIDPWAKSKASSIKNNKDVLIFGGSSSSSGSSRNSTDTDGPHLSSDAYVLDTHTWEWRKLFVPTNEEGNSLRPCPPSLVSPSIASVGVNNNKSKANQCMIFGGATIMKTDDDDNNNNNKTRILTPSNETWLLTINGYSANWEQVAIDEGEGENSNNNNNNNNNNNYNSPIIVPEGRMAASLTATSPTELVLQGGYDPISRNTFGGYGKTWILTKYPIDPNIAKQKKLQQEQQKQDSISQDMDAASHISDVIASTGSGNAWEGETLGVGGLDDILKQIKRRIWTPLAAPPQLLKELGIQPTRGLLLYGKPGCGKTLLASTLGSMLSPFRPITVVNGPEIMDKFVGSSEKNLRELFDNPPDIYDKFKQNCTDAGMVDAMNRAAIHVIVMDEFDAVARSRGGNDGKGGQGDSGVARDSVVNQLLAKMDGVQPLAVPTLVIGLTNKRSLIEPALLRPGRFEVQIEIPLPNSIEQRVSILMVHTKHMFAAGRLQVTDPPPESPAERLLLLEEGNTKPSHTILTYDQLAKKLAIASDGFSGAAIAGVARAAASRALERAVSSQFSIGEHNNGSDDDDNDTTIPPSTIMDCLVTQDDFYQAINDVRESMGTHDHTEDYSSFDDDSSTNSSNTNTTNDATSSDELLGGKHVNGVIIDEVVKDGSIL